MTENVYRVESEEEVKAYLAKVRYALETGAKLVFQEERKVDEDPQVVLRRELASLTVEEYLRTVKDTRFPKKSEMREFGKVYNGSEEIYIKVRIELLDSFGFGEHTAFVMSFHYAIKPFCREIFPYRK